LSGSLIVLNQRNAHANPSHFGLKL
jgi:hypothetical protein